MTFKNALPLERSCTECGKKFAPKYEISSTCSSSCHRKSLKYAEKECSFYNCTEMFIPTNSTSLFCFNKHYGECQNCNNKFDIKATSKPRLICSPCRKEEALKRRRATNLEKYGVENVSQVNEFKEKIKISQEEKYGGIGFASEAISKKRKKTMEDRYGADTPMASEEISNKARATMMERYGVENPSSSPEIQKKKRQTNQEKYGSEHPMQNEKIKAKVAQTTTERHGGIGFASPAINSKIRETMKKNHGATNPMLSSELKKKIHETNLEKYGFATPFESPEIQKKVRATLLERYSGIGWASPVLLSKIKTTQLDKYGTEWPSQSPEIMAKIQATFSANAVNNLGSGRISKLNIAWAEIFKAKGYEVTLESGFGQYAADLKINNILLDLNPTISHNGFLSYACLIKQCEVPCDVHKPVKKSYHFQRAVKAKELGLKYLQFYDWDSPETIIALVESKVKTGFRKYSARKLIKKRISQKEANDFLKGSHIQGAAKNQAFCYGLFLPTTNELLAVATFGKARFKANADFEWIRYAVKENTIIHGGAGKLWHTFREEIKPASVISYVDFNHTTAPLTFLNGLGFEEQAPTGASIAWSKGTMRIYNNSLLSLGADRLLGTTYGSPEECGLRNDDIMILEGWLPVLTAGNRVFLYS